MNVTCSKNNPLTRNCDDIRDDINENDLKQLGGDFARQDKKSENDMQVYFTNKLEEDICVNIRDKDSELRLGESSAQPKLCKSDAVGNHTRHMEEEIRGEGSESSFDVGSKSSILDLEEENRSENRWDCSICFKNFKTKRMLYFHTRNIHRDPTSCLHCKLSFTSKLKFQKHLKKVHEDKMTNKVICHKCGKKLCGNLKRHLSVCDKLKMIKKRTSNMKIQCTYCNKSFLKSSMKKHVNRKHQIVVRTGSSFYYSNITAKYMQKQKVSLYICNICCVSFTRKYSLIRHNKLFHRETKDNKINMKSDFIIWDESVSKAVKPSICTHCKVIFKDRVSLQKHKKKEHSLLDSFECSLCTNRYTSKKSLRAHKSLDHSGKIFHCTLCEYSSKRKYDLKRHSKVHTNKRKPLKDIEKLSRNNKFQRIKKITQNINKSITILSDKDKKKILSDLIEQNTDILDTHSQCPLDEEDVISMVKDVNMSDRQVLQILTKIRAKWGSHMVTSNIKTTLKERKQIVSHLFNVELLDKDDKVHFLGKDDKPITR